MSFSDVAMAMWRRKWVVVLCALLGALAVLLVGRPDGVLSTRYSAITNLVVAGEAERSDVVLYGYVATATDAVSETAVEELGTDWNVERVFNEIMVSSNPEIGTIQIQIENIESEAEAARIVEVFADRLIDYASADSSIEHASQIEELVRRRTTLRTNAVQQQQQLEAARPVQEEGQPPVEFQDDPVLTTQLVASLSSLSTVLSELEALEAIGPEDLVPLVVVGPPTTTSALVGGETLGFAGRMLVAIGLGALLGTILVAGAAAFDTTIYNRKDILAGAGAPLLAEVPILPRAYRKDRKIIAAEMPTSPHAEAFRFLRTQLTRPLQRVEDETGFGWVMVVASPNVAAGKSTVTANLAYSFTQVGKSVLVISADLRKPTIDRYFHVRSGLGLTELLASDPFSSVLGSASGDTDTPGITVLRHGPKTEIPGETLRLLGPTIESARQSYDVILIDSAPMGIGNDFGEIAAFADHTLIVARAGKTGIEDLLWAEATCEEFDVKVAGVALAAAPVDRNQRVTQRRYRTRRRLFSQGREEAVGIRATDFVDSSHSRQAEDAASPEVNKPAARATRNGSRKRPSVEASRKQQRRTDLTVARRPFFDEVEEDDFDEELWDLEIDNELDSNELNNDELADSELFDDEYDGDELDEFEGEEIYDIELDEDGDVPPPSRRPREPQERPRTETDQVADRATSNRQPKRDERPKQSERDEVTRKPRRGTSTGPRPRMGAQEKKQTAKAGSAAAKQDRPSQKARANDPASRKATASSSSNGHASNGKAAASKAGSSKSATSKASSNQSAPSDTRQQKPSKETAASRSRTQGAT